ncbi:MAG: glycosyltransferase [Chlorobaculum sp.]
MISTANFFWHGQLSLYEYACIASFVKHNFTVQVFTFDDTMQIPAGATLRHAGDILSEKQLFSYTQSGQKGSLAAFSDAFRLHLLKKEGGWWFDTDVLCLKDADVFRETVRSKPKPLSMGWQNSKYINGGILYAEDEPFVDALLLHLEKAGKVFVWGEIGPKLITSVIKEFGYEDCADPVERYYPVDGTDLVRMFDPGDREWCDGKVSESLGVHLWNEVIRRLCIPKNVLPPKGSFLAEKFLAICPEMVNFPYLPLETALRLYDYPRLEELARNKAMKPVHKSMEAIAKLTKRLKKK